MLKIFESDTETASAELVLDELVRNNTDGSRHVILTPDRFSLSVERKLFEYTGLPGAMNIDVYSFTNFAKRAVTALPKCLTKEGTVMLLREVLETEAKNLEYYQNAVRIKSFPKELFAVIASIRNSGITPETLYATFSDGKDTAAAKYRDVARLYAAYQAALSKKYTDTTGRLDALSERAATLPAVTERHFYLVGFFEFYQKQLQVIESLVTSAQSVNVAHASGRGANAVLFGEKFISDMQAIKRRTGSAFERHRKEGAASEPMKTLSENIFAYRTGTIPPSKNAVFFQENTPYDEMKAASREITRLVREEGYRYREIAVVAYDESYKGVVKDIFLRFGIPYFTDEKYPLKTAASVRWFSEAMAVIAENYRQSAVLAFLKNPLFPAPREETDAFENYVLKYNVNFKNFTLPFYRGSEEESAGAEAVRRTLCAALPAFPDAMTVRTACAAAKAFFTEDLKLREAALAASAEDGAYAKLHEQAAELFGRQLDEMEEVLGDKSVTVAAFRERAQSAILSVSVSLIPIKNDCVFVGTGEESALYGIKALFIVGAAEGIVPAVGGYQAIMPEKDVMSFERRGIPLYPTPVDRMREEKAKLVLLMRKAEERLYVGYSSYNLFSEPMGASGFLKELSAVSGYPICKLSDRFRAEDVRSESDALSYLVSRENALYEYRNRRGRGGRENPAFFAALEGKLCEWGYDTDAHAAAAETLTTSRAALFFRRVDGKYATAASQLERYAACPYRHFLDYGLKICEREEAEAKSADIGNIVHRTLEIYFKNTLGRLKTMQEREVAAETARAIETAFREEKSEVLSETKFGKILFSALEKELSALLPRLTEHVKNSEFEPKFIEYPFRAADGIAIDTSFGGVALTGKIDRADVFGKDIFLIDYKTGAVSTKLTDLYEGRKTQLALYSLPFQAKGFRVVGTYYLPIADGYRKGGKNLSLQGYTLSASGIAGAFDKKYCADGEWESEFFPLKNKVTKARGAELAAKSDTKLFSETEFSAVNSMAVGVAKNSAEEIYAGYVAKRPAKGECEYCPYQPLCEEKRERKSFNVKMERGVVVRAEQDGEDVE